MSLNKTFATQYWLAPTWSLAIEEQFYLFLPAIVFFVPRRILPFLFGALIVLAPVLRAITGEFYYGYIQTLCRADSLIMGALLAWCVREPGILQFLKAQRRRLYLILAGLAAGALVITWRGPIHGGPVDHFWLAALYATLILLAYVDAESRLARCLRCRVLVWLGTLSYGIYLFHQPVAGTFHAWWSGQPPRIINAWDGLITCLALIVTLLLAWCSFRLFERRFIEFGHRFHYRSNRPDAPCLLAGAQAMGK